MRDYRTNYFAKAKYDFVDLFLRIHQFMEHNGFIYIYWFLLTDALYASNIFNILKSLKFSTIETYGH